MHQFYWTAPPSMYALSIRVTAVFININSKKKLLPKVSVPL
jgi:hypothetical protein